LEQFRHEGKAGINECVDIM